MLTAERRAQDRAWLGYPADPAFVNGDPLVWIEAHEFVDGLPDPA